MEKKTLEVKIKLLEQMLGTAPDPEVYTNFIASKAPKGTDTDEEIETLEELEDKGTTRFHKDDNGLFIYNYMILGFLKEAGNALKEQLNIKALKSKIEKFVFVYPRKIYLGKTEADSVLERPLRIMSAKGMRTALAKSECVDAGLELSFRIVLLDNKEVTPETIKEILEYGQFKGLAQWRNAGYGSFEIVSIQEV